MFLFVSCCFYPTTRLLFIYLSLHKRQINVLSFRTLTQKSNNNDDKTKSDRIKKKISGLFDLAVASWYAFSFFPCCCWWWCCTCNAVDTQQLIIMTHRSGGHPRRRGEAVATACRYFLNLVSMFRGTSCWPPNSSV